jgi:hypothetical protein
MNQIISKLPVFADIFGIIFFSWITYYFYRKSLESPLTYEENALFLFVVSGLIIDTFFVFSIIILPLFFISK